MYSYSRLPSLCHWYVVNCQHCMHSALILGILTAACTLSNFACNQGCMLYSVLCNNQGSMHPALILHILEATYTLHSYCVLGSLVLKAAVTLL
jgi:hypothetical protein